MNPLNPGVYQIAPLLSRFSHAEGSGDASDHGDGCVLSGEPGLLPGTPLPLLFLSSPDLVRRCPDLLSSFLSFSIRRPARLRILRPSKYPTRRLPPLSS